MLRKIFFLFLFLSFDIYSFDLVHGPNPNGYEIKFPRSQSGNFLWYRHIRSKNDPSPLRLCKNEDGTFQKFSFHVDETANSLSLIAEGVTVASSVRLTDTTICKKSSKPVLITGDVEIDDSFIQGGTIEAPLNKNKRKTEDRLIRIYSSEIHGDFQIKNKVIIDQGNLRGDNTIDGRLNNGISLYKTNLYEGVSKDGDGHKIEGSVGIFESTIKGSIHIVGDVPGANENFYIEINSTTAEGAFDIKGNLLIGANAKISGSGTISGSFYSSPYTSWNNIRTMILGSNISGVTDFSGHYQHRGEAINSTIIGAITEIQTGTNSAIIEKMFFEDGSHIEDATIEGVTYIGGKVYGATINGYTTVPSSQPVIGRVNIGADSTVTGSSTRITGTINIWNSHIIDSTIINGALYNDTIPPTYADNILQNIQVSNSNLSGGFSMIGGNATGATISCSRFLCTNCNVTGTPECTP